MSTLCVVSASGGAGKSAEEGVSCVSALSMFKPHVNVWRMCMCVCVCVCGCGSREGQRGQKYRLQYFALWLRKKRREEKPSTREWGCEGGRRNLPDGVAGSHPDPLWDWPVLLHGSPELGLDVECLVGRL